MCFFGVPISHKQGSMAFCDPGLVNYHMFIFLLETTKQFTLHYISSTYTSIR